MATPLAHPPAIPAADATVHPAFAPLRPWLARLGDRTDLEALNELALASKTPPVTASGHPVTFCVPAAAGARHYELRVFETGRVETRPGNLHDLFNALAWMAFPQTKAAINARHAACLPFEAKKRGPLRDLLTLVDEGGVIIACASDCFAGFESLVREFRWQELFWDRREQLLAGSRFVLFGHSAFEKALCPYPGITCKALFLPLDPKLLEAPQLVEILDAAAAAWILDLPADASPRRMPPLPVFGYPGWLPGSDNPAFYADRRWFRAAPVRRPAGKLERNV